MLLWRHRRTCSPASLAVSATLFYVFVYTIWLKPRSPQNIVIGGAAGAVPVLVGWAAVTGSLAAPAWLMFAIVFFWTPPHFWALSIRYRDDYAAAGIPMLPVVKGIPAAARQIARLLVRRHRGDARARARSRRSAGATRRRRVVLGVMFVVPGGPAPARPDARSARSSCSRSRTSTSRCCSSPLPSTPSSAPSPDAARRRRIGIGALGAHRGGRRSPWSRSSRR